MIPSGNLDPGRKSLPHLPPKEVANQSIILFLTVCTKDRKSVLNRQEIHSLLENCWIAADTWKVGRYILMPDHIHMFCSPSSFPPTPLKPWVRFWKSMASKRWPNNQDKPIWQRDFFDRQLRSGESYQDKWTYVAENPVRADLVGESKDWPFQGELNVLEWHEQS
jgi:REP element-mobilizing transposase RayT